MSESVQTAASRLEAIARRVWLAFLLAWVAGFVDVTGYLVALRVFTSHMSGNSVAMMASLAGQKWDEALRHGFPIPLFVLGIFAGAVLEIIAGRKGVRQHLVVILLLEAVLLIGSIFCASGTPRPYLLTALLALAMGLQSSGLRRVWGRSVHTAYVTGMLGHFAESIAVLLFSDARDRKRRIRQRRIALYGGIWAAFAMGGLCGGFGSRRWGCPALIIPLGALAFIIFWNLLHPMHSPDTVQGKIPA